MILKRLSVLLCPILLFLALELLFYNIKLVYFVIPLIIICLIFFLKILIEEKIFSKDFFYLSLLPFLLVFSTIGFLILLNIAILRHAVIVVFVIILGIYLENIFVFFNQPQKYLSYSLENLSAFINLLVFFLTLIYLNAFSIFLNLPIWLLSLILIVITALLLLQSFWINKINDYYKFVYLIIINVVVLEFFWALSFLPTNFYVISIFLAIIYYLIFGIFKAKLNKKLDKKLIMRYIVISSILIFTIILTSPWT